MVADREQEAMTIVREAMQADMSDPKAILLVAKITFYAEMYDEWEKVLRTGIALNRQKRELRDEFIEGLLEQRKLDEVYQARLDVAKTWPDDAENEIELVMLAPHLQKPVDPQIHIDRVYALHAAGKWRHEGFKRDQFQVGDKWVVVAEAFAVTDDRPNKYVFTLFNPADKKKEYSVGVGSESGVTAALRKFRVVTDADQPYFVAAERETVERYGIFRNLPPYEQVREVAKEIFEGKRQQSGKLIEPPSKPR